MDVLKRLSRFLAGAVLPEQQRDGGREIRLAGLIVLVGTLTAAVFHLAVHLTTGKGYPYDTFLFDPRGTFNDFNSVYHMALVYGPPHTTDRVYSTPLHLLMTYATALPDVVVWMIFNAVFLATLVAVVWYGVTRRVGGRRLRQAYTAIFVALSYPVLFALQLGNLEMLMFVLLAAFAYLHYERKSRWSWVPLALASPRFSLGLSQRREGASAGPLPCMCRQLDPRTRVSRVRACHLRCADARHRLSFADQSD